jgi:hypothetical protein
LSILVNLCSTHFTSDVRLLTPPHVQHYWAWCIDINGGLYDSENLMAGGPTDHEGDSDTILKFES